MAKRRRVIAQSPPADVTAAVGDSAPLYSGVGGLDPMSIAIGLLGAAVIYVSYYPSDSVSVERGSALWFAFLSIAIATIALTSQLWLGAARGGGRTPDRLELASWTLDAAVWLSALWMMTSAFASAPPGNLRMATNEAWLWVSAAAIFTSARRMCSSLRVRQAVLSLIVVCSFGLSIHGLHQYYVSLPQNREEYRIDPERILKLAGVDAPPGSSERMVFENRLFDGGPTATFALANSLAAVLLAGILISSAALGFRWRDLTPKSRIALILIALACVACLLAARSRSAAFAMLMGLVMVLIAASRLRERNPKVLAFGLGAVTSAGILGAVFLALRGNREWFEEAPASLAFRFQYWRSTWQMVLDRPLVGAGPGNFQSIYERYREPSATEQIAEPHNFFFETLAGGGFVAAALLVLIFAVAIALIWFRRNRDPVVESDETTRDRWLWLGAVLGFLMIWLLGWASRQTPDFSASIFVVPLSAAAALVVAPIARRMGSRELDSIAAIVIASIGLHLTVAGGWTVPGVAMVLWLAAAMLTRCDAVDGGRSDGKPPAAAAIAVSGLVALALLYGYSIGPVENQKRLMATAAMAQSKGQSAKVRATLREAADADPWSPDGMLWLADHYRWQLITAGDNEAVRRQWMSALAEVRKRGGDDPAIYRMVGVQQLHLYQRHGRQADLDAAAKTFATAAAWSPANQWMIAQSAVLAGARGEVKKAQNLARRAIDLSKLGGNIERAIARQQVYVARPLGSAADRGPVRRAADQLLPEPKPTP